MSSKLTLVKTLPRYLANQPLKVFTEEQITAIISDFARAINQPLDGRADIYIRYLVEQEILTEATIEGESRMVKRYLTGEASQYAIGASLQKNGYVSHRTAAYIHQLLQQKTSTIYISSEGSERPSNDSILEQINIDKAFQKAQRQSGASMIYGDTHFVLLNSLHTAGAGIEKKEDYSVTNLERTLIDMTIRPAYAGGPAAILKAYMKALPRLSIPAMLTILDRLNLKYPYHQSIGFYLSQAGYPDLASLDILKEREWPTGSTWIMQWISLHFRMNGISIFQINYERSLTSKTTRLAAIIILPDCQLPVFQPGHCA